MAQRIDAVRNRRALVAAAEQVFADVGPDAPLELVAKRAHVGRGTLYRHFKDRIDLAAAVYEEHLTELEEYVTARADEPEIALELMTRIAELQGQARGIQPLLLRAATGRERLATLSSRTRALLAGPLATSKRAGVISDDITIEDLLVAVDMVEGALGSLGRDEAPGVARRAFSLLIPALQNGPGQPLSEFWVEPKAGEAAS